jgi:L-aspartate oxidase
LLEGLVVGRRAAAAVARDLACGLLGGTLEPAPLPAAAVADRSVVQRTMTRYAGIGRDAEGLATAAQAIDRSAIVRPLWTTEAVEDSALTLTARILLAAASARTESRGCHLRTDHPARDDVRWRHSMRVRLDVSGQPILVAPLALRGVA